MLLKEALYTEAVLNIVNKTGYLLEGAINDFNKLISRDNQFFFIISGSPRSGKSFIVDKYIKSKIRNLSTSNPDDISLAFTKDPNAYYQGSTKMSRDKALNYLKKDRKDKGSFVYDSTGGDIGRVSVMSNQGKNNGYKVIVLSVFAPLKTTIQRNAAAERNVDQEYLKDSWKQAQKNISKINKTVSPFKHFVVVNMGSNQYFYEYDGKRIKR